MDERALGKDIEELSFGLFAAAVQDYAIFLLDPTGHVRTLYIRHHLGC